MPGAFFIDPSRLCQQPLSSWLLTPYHNNQASIKGIHLNT